MRVIQNLKEDIAKCEDRIEQLTKAHPDFALFDSLPGAGDALVPRLIAALGTRRERFESAAEIQAYTGVAPVVRQSGNTRSTHCRKAYPHFLWQTFHEWAAHSIMKSDWAREYYEQQLARGNKHHATVRALAFKMDSDFEFQYSNSSLPQGMATCEATKYCIRTSGRYSVGPYTAMMRPT